MRTQPPGAESSLQGLDKLIDTSPGLCRNRDASGKSPAINRGQIRIFQQIDFVENEQCLFAKGIEFFDHAIDRRHLFVHPGMTEICHVNKQIGFADFLGLSLEGFDKKFGSLRKNPTVSVSRTRCLLGSVKLRVVGSSVAKSLSTARTSAPVIKFS